jgi:hypothetical protein
MIAGRYLRKNMPYKGLAHVFRRIQGLSALFLFVVLGAFEKFLKVSCPLFEIRPLLTSKGKILTSLNQFNASGVSQ